MDFICNSLQALITLRAISPLFAIIILEISFPISDLLYRLMLPCFLTGLVCLLFCIIFRALTIIILVSIGSITRSIIPFSAAMYGFANFSRYSAASFFLISIGFLE